MARNTRAKKQPEAHKIDGAEIFAALRDLEKARAYVDREIKRRTGCADLDSLAKREAQE